MGQKVHPGGLRVGVIHDWKSNWYVGKKEFPKYILEDVQIRDHINTKLGHAGLSDILIRKDKQRITVDIFTARPGIVIGKSGRRGRRASQGAALDHGQERPHQHQRDQAARAGREARRPVDRRAAAEPRQLPPRDEALAGLGDALGRPGDQDPVRRPPRRRRDEPLGALHRGPHPAAHDPRRHRLRLRRGEDDLRPHRRQGLDQQGRDHAGGLRGHDHRQGHAPRRPGSGPPPARWRGRGSRRLARVAAAAAAQDREGLGLVKKSRRPGGRPAAAVPAAPVAAPAADARARASGTSRPRRQDSVEQPKHRRERRAGRGASSRP